MKIYSNIEIVNDAYVAQVGIQAVSPTEQEALDRFGEPAVDVGGSFTGSLTRPGDVSPTAVAFILPSKQYYLPSTFPVQQTFSLADFEDADVRAEVYRQTIVVRIGSARTTILARAANFVGETLVTL
jgi:hypothetical protein